ncbi:MAG: ABC transporter permease [Clostridiales Family XIII bacterium]|jgi:peptide/nickel transport system permease protein|nr:ABC transporter permease [Clostridiales Family XIII bacterium]
MVIYIIKRLLYMIPVLLGVSLLIFTVLYLTPGDPADIILSPQTPEEIRSTWRDQFGLNDPFFVQFFDFVTGIVLHWDWGTSLVNGQPVTDEIMLRFPATFLLACLTTVIAAVIGILLGVLAAKHQNSWIDTTSSVVGMMGVSMPQFWLGLLLIIWFGLNLQWFPISGFSGPKYWVLPSIALGVQNAAILMRFTRTSVLDCIRQDYVRTARAKGQVERVITWHHTVRNALIPIITTVGGLFGGALGSAMVLEQIFSINGLGRLMVDAIAMRNYPVIRASVLILAVSYSVIYLVLDLLYAAVDPRIKADFKSVPGARLRKGHFSRKVKAHV